jgi:hypothetical protein
MADRIRTDEEERLADRLRREAQATRPAFSEALHARICQAVKRCEPPVPRRATPWWLRSRWLPVAIAAMLLVSISLVTWLLNRSTGPAPRLREPGGAVAQTPDPVADAEMITRRTADTAKEVGMLVDSTLSTGQWAYLDHDARVAVQLLINQFPLDVASVE